MSKARELVLKLLTTDWLVPEAEIPAGASLCTMTFFLSLYFVAHWTMPCSGPTRAGASAHPPAVRSGAHPPPSHDPRLLADTHTRVRSYRSSHVNSRAHPSPIDISV